MSHTIPNNPNVPQISNSLNIHLQAYVDHLLSALGTQEI